MGSAGAIVARGAGAVDDGGRAFCGVGERHARGSAHWQVATAQAQHSAPRVREYRHGRPQHARGGAWLAHHADEAGCCRH